MHYISRKPDAARVAARPPGSLTHDQPPTGKEFPSMTATGHDSLNTRRTLDVEGKSYDYFSLAAASEKLGDVSRLPYSLKVLLENLLRFEDGRSVSTGDIQALVDWQVERRSDREIAYRPARVLMQDFTGVPAVVDLAAMRDAVTALGADPQIINPLSPVDLVIDHSVMVDRKSTTYELQSLMRISYAVFSLKKKKNKTL